jgi:hypothetical protein
MAGQLWMTDTLGGYFYSLNLSDELRMSVAPLERFRQFADAKDASQMQGKRAGATYTWDVVSSLGRADRTLVETNTMPESNFTITQGTLTMNECGVSVH